MNAILGSVRATISPDIGLDLGTANTVVYERGAGVIVSEPSVVAYDLGTEEIVAIGNAAIDMEGRLPDRYRIVRPLRRGTISDFLAAQTLVARLVDRALSSRPRLAPRLVTCVPGCATDIECKAVEQAVRAAGARYTTYLPQAVAAAVGAGLDVTSRNAQMVVDIGGGTTDVAVISLGGIVVSQSLRVAGNKLDEAIIRHIRRVYNLMIGERTSEEIKIRIGSAYRLDQEIVMEIRGRDLINGLPKTVKITSEEVRESLSEPLQSIVEAVKSVLEKTPPELASDIIDRGIILTGGGALLRGLDTLLAEVTGIPVIIAEDPLSCVAIGTGLRVRL